MRFQLHEIEPLLQIGADNPLCPIDVVLEAEVSQPDVSQGLRFDVMFTNLGPNPIEIQDPDNTIGIALTDTEGRRIPMSTNAPSALINTIRRPGPHHYAPDVLRLQPYEGHRATVLLGVPGSASSETSLSPGRYEVHVTSLLLAAEAGLKREYSYRLLSAGRVSISFGLDVHRTEDERNATKTS